MRSILGIISIAMILASCQAGIFGLFAVNEDKQMTKYLHNAEDWSINSLLIQERTDSTGWGDYEVTWDTTITGGTMTFTKEEGNGIATLKGILVVDGATIPFEYDCYGSTVGTHKGNPALFLTLTKDWRNYKSNSEVEHQVPVWEKDHFIFESDIYLGGNPTQRMRYRFEIVAQ